MAKLLKEETVGAKFDIDLAWALFGQEIIFTTFKDNLHLLDLIRQ